MCVLDWDIACTSSSRIGLLLKKIAQLIKILVKKSYYLIFIFWITTGGNHMQWARDGNVYSFNEFNEREHYFQPVVKHQEKIAAMYLSENKYNRKTALILVTSSGRHYKFDSLFPNSRHSVNDDWYYLPKCDGFLTPTMASAYQSMARAIASSHPSDLITLYPTPFI